MITTEMTTKQRVKHLGLNNVSPIGMHCEWTLSTSPGTRIQLNVTSADLVHNAIRFHGGVDATAPLLKEVTSAVHKTLTLTTTGNHLFINATTSPGGDGRFAAQFATLPSGETCKAYT